MASGAIAWLIGLGLIGFLVVYGFFPSLLPPWIREPLNMPVFQLDPNPIKTYDQLSYILSGFPASTQIWSNWYAWFTGEPLEDSIIGVTDSQGSLLYSRQCLLGDGTYAVSVWTVVYGQVFNKVTIMLTVEYGSGGDVG